MSAPNVPLVAITWLTRTAQASVKGRHFTPTSIEWVQEDSWIQLEISLSIVRQLYVYTEPAPPMNWCSVASVIEVCKVMCCVLRKQNTYNYDQVTHCRLVVLVYCTLEQLYCLSIPGCILSPIDHCGISLVCLHWLWTHPLVSWLHQYCICWLDSHHYLQKNLYNYIYHVVNINLSRSCNTYCSSR